MGLPVPSLRHANQARQRAGWREKPPETEADAEMAGIAKNRQQSTSAATSRNLKNVALSRPSPLSTFREDTGPFTIRERRFINLQWRRSAVLGSFHDTKKRDESRRLEAPVPPIRRKSWSRCCATAFSPRPFSVWPVQPMRRRSHFRKVRCRASTGTASPLSAASAMPSRRSASTAGCRRFRWRPIPGLLTPRRLAPAAPRARALGVRRQRQRTAFSSTSPCPAPRMPWGSGRTSP